MRNFLYALLHMEYVETYCNGCVKTKPESEITHRYLAAAMAGKALLWLSYVYLFVCLCITMFVNNTTAKRFKLLS